MLTTTIKSLNAAERLVEQQQRLGNDVRWDNYDMVFFRPDARAIYSKDGAFRNGEWGFENRSPINDNGEWTIDRRNIKRAKHSRA